MSRRTTKQRRAARRRRFRYHAANVRRVCALIGSDGISAYLGGLVAAWRTIRRNAS